MALPNGLIGNMYYDSVEGKKHDAAMLVDSNLLHELQANAIYGDPAYPLGLHLQAPFRQAALTPAMQDYNAAMSSVRISVEWLFGDVINYFKFMDFGMSSVGKMYIVCALLHNALTCLYGNKTSEFFYLDPPSLQYYFR
ncbi:hypothetical protein QZH41_009029 [Actinostola sp. cb2023]|nr:hypothetical protein QZH41_009029 [Actinostola sp. cb2023]